MTAFTRRLVSVIVTVIAGASWVLVPANATDRTAQPNLELFQAFRTYGDSGQGWTGGDSTYSVLLPDGRTVWIFSDTFLGEVNADHSRSRSTPMIHNSLVVQDGAHMTTLRGMSEYHAKVEPREPVGFYWMGDGTVEGDKLRIFVLRFVAVPGVFAFAQVGLDIATFSLPSLDLVSVEPSPSGLLPTKSGLPVSYGSAIMEHGEYTYVYGVEDISREKFLHLARVPAGALTGAAWEFFDGQGWSRDPMDSARLLDGIANEFSVVQDGGTYRLITQDHGIGRHILEYGAPAPWGPFSWKRVAYTTPESGGNIITYNAHEHPQFDRGDTFTISYNVNSFDSNDIYREVDNYRPRFIDIPDA